MGLQFDIDSFNPWSVTEDRDEESVTNKMRKGTSLDPPHYDSRTIFSVFSNGATNKRVVDMDQIWKDANSANATLPVVEPTDGMGSEPNKKKLQRIKNSHSRHIRPSTNTKVVLQQQIEKHKESFAAIKRANSHPSLQTAHDLQASKNHHMKHSVSNFSTPISYHGFLAAEMKRSSWDREASLSPPSADPNIAILKEIYQIR
ncbi:uncharacterized protein LOC134812750 isoform X2 [Bolinopsis microptera]|uniref:uncharacterized protein LOC134812750 isoform X2 n=1 Tax=Bolinopsis microptera TaxID=2820187 RepID=UPI00307A4BD5